MRAALSLVSVAALAVPAHRRRDFLNQWRADLAHYAQWLERRREPHPRFRLLARASGAMPHAIQLRILHWSPRMLGQDLKFAWRLFVRRRALTATAILIVGLGIGANATIFSWVEGIVLRPLAGVPAQARLIAVRGVEGGRDNLSMSYPNYLDFRAARADGLQDVTAFRIVPMNARTAGEPLHVFGELVTANFFDVLGVRPALGRTFRADEGETPGREPVVVASHGFWMRALGGDPSAVGRPLVLNGQPLTVIGVTPPGFQGSVAGLALDLFVPMTLQKQFIAGDRLSERGNSWLQVYGRLEDGAPLSRAKAGVSVVGRRLAAAFPDNNKDRSLSAVHISDDGASGLLKPVMTTLMGVVGLVLLIACANLAGLLLASGTGRQREIAVRLAVGASRGRVLRQMLVENLMLAAAGGTAGLIVAGWTSGMMRLFVPPTPYPIALGGAVSPRVVACGVALTALTAILSGLVPAVRGSRADVADALKASAPTTVGGGRGRLRQALVVAQVALSLLLLVCAALCVRSLAWAQTMDVGYSARQGFVGSIDLLAAGYDEVRAKAFYQQALARIARVPGVERASVATAIPLDLGSGSNMTVQVDGYTPRDGEIMDAYYNRVGPGYFDTLGVDLVEGRRITERDVAEQPAVVVINETMARRYFGGRSALGGVIRFGRGPVSVVGVARDGKYRRLNEGPTNYLYLPILQSFSPAALLLVRSAADPGAVIPAVQRELRALDRDLPLFDVRTFEQHRRVGVFIARMISLLLGLFGILALVLAIVGLYGVIAYAVTLRTREIGVRVVLGAERSTVAWFVMRQGLALAGLGVLAGLGLAFGASRLLSSQLVGISPGDPVSFAATSALLLAVAGAACAIPARRAASLNPLTALRRD
jgi:predicted permease